MSNFDTEATPFCDFLDIDPCARDWKEVAKSIERRARFAEEKLRITSEMLSIIDRRSTIIDAVVEDSQDSINRILGFKKVSE